MAAAPHEFASSPPFTSDATIGALKLPALDNTYGALLLGAAFGFMLYGLTLHQTYRYFRLYPTDIPLLRWLVLAILVLETFHTIMALVGCYFHLITNYFNPPSLLVGHWSTRLITPLTGITVLVCQSFYARRVWHVGINYRYIVGVAGIPMLALLAFSIAATIEGFKLSLNDFRHVSWMASAVFGFAVLGDFILTGALIFVLWRSRTGFKRTDSTIEALIVYTVNTGFLTTVVGLLGFVFAIIVPGNFIYIGISIVGTKLYANSVLAVLNSRRALSNKMLEGFEVGTFEPHSARMRPHTVVETWDVPGPQVRFPVDLPMTESHMSFATPANNASSFGPDIGTAASIHSTKVAPSGMMILDVKSDK